MYIINCSHVFNSLIFKVRYFRKHLLFFFYDAILELTLYVKKYFMSSTNFTFPLME